MTDKQQNKEIWVFLSHSNEDYDKVRKVRNMLEEQELRPIMFFLKCLSDDDEIDELIKREIDCRTRFILCDSDNARHSKWVQKEIDYIKSQQKPYEVIDLSKSDEQILKQLKEVKRRSKLLISYARQDHYLASVIFQRLSKYDYEVFVDFNNIVGGDSFANRIKEEIQSSVENGCIIALLTENGIKSQWVNKEIEYARGYDKINQLTKSSIIPIIVGDNIPEKYSDLSCISFSTNTEDLANIIVDSIIRKLLNPGEILTYYRNFKTGVNCSVDLIEAKRLGSIYYNWAKEADNENRPSGVISLGLCYEEGIGVDINLQKAYEQYRDPISTDGCAVEMAKRVHRKLHPEQYIEKQHDASKGIFNRILKLFKYDN